MGIQKRKFIEFEDLDEEELEEWYWYYLVEKEEKDEKKKKKGKEKNDDIVVYYKRSEDVTWDTGLSIIRSCPYMTSDRKLLLRYHVIELARLLTQHLSGLEWLFYCKYEEVDNYVVVGECSIPEQEVTGGSVTVLKPIDYPVVIHHHPFHSSSFSHTDDEYINANNDISILHDVSGFTKAVMKKKLPCGHYAMVDISISGIMVVNSIEEEKNIARKIFEEGKDRIRRKEYQWYGYPYPYDYPYYRYYNDKYVW